MAQVVRVFPDEESLWRLVGAVLMEVESEWAGRRYMVMNKKDVYGRCL